MSSESVKPPEKLATIARVILLGGIAVVLGLIVISPKNSTIVNPLTVGRAQADGSICAAPGYLMLTMPVGAASKLYLNDTNKQVLCVYEVTGDKLRLVNARKYDHDSAIFDMSIPGAQNKVPEGGNGITRDEAKSYGDGIQKTFTDYKKKFKLE